MNTKCKNFKAARRERDRQVRATREWETALDCTLEQLDGERWGKPEFLSYVVTTCHALRFKPIQTLTDEELRLAIGQQIGLQWLVRLAVERLKEDPFRSGDFYNGDLLKNVLSVPPGFWSKHSKEHHELWSILAALEPDSLPDDLESTVRHAIRHFLSEKQSVGQKV